MTSVMPTSRPPAPSNLPSRIESPRTTIKPDGSTTRDDDDDSDDDDDDDDDAWLPSVSIATPSSAAFAHADGDTTHSLRGALNVRPPAAKAREMSSSVT